MIRRDFWLEVVAKHEGTHDFGRVVFRPPTINGTGGTIDLFRPWWVDKTGDGAPVYLDLEPDEFRAVKIGDLFRVSIEETGPKPPDPAEAMLTVLVDGTPLVVGRIGELLLATKYANDPDLLGSHPLRFGPATRLEILLEPPKPRAVSPTSEDPPAGVGP